MGIDQSKAIDVEEMKRKHLRQHLPKKPTLLDFADLKSHVGIVGFPARGGVLFCVSDSEHDNEAVLMLEHDGKFWYKNAMLEWTYFAARPVLAEKLRIARIQLQRNEIGLSPRPDYFRYPNVPFRWAIGYAQQKPSMSRKEEIYRNANPEFFDKS